jgi:FkbM family methyltransferase
MGASKSVPLTNHGSASPEGVHLDFIEIGTSDFDTCIQEATEGTWGLSVEPLRPYLDNLPEKPHVKKVQQAVSDRSGTIDFFYLEPDTIRQLKLPRWVRGCNSVDKPHPQVASLLRKRGFQDPTSMFTKDVVRVTDVPTLLREHNVASVHFLKIDTEGHDCTILRSWLAACQQNPAWYPMRIQFESNKLSDKAEVAAVCQLFADVGYNVRKAKKDTYLWL